MKLVIHTDGACPGNPGPMSIGVVIYKDGKIIKEISKNIGKGTNNKAEYLAVIEGLEQAQKLKAKEVTIKSDSNLTMNKLNRMWKIKDFKLKALFEKIEELEKRFDKVSYLWVRRDENRRADWLANQAL